MRSRRGLLGPLPIIAVLVPLIVHLYLKDSPYDHSMAAPLGHFIIVSAASLLAAVFAVLIGLAGQTQRNVQVVFLATAFMSLAFLFMLHGLSTPGFILPSNPVTGIASQLSLLVTSVWLFLSSLSSDARPVRWLGRHINRVLGAWTAVMVAVVVLGMAKPELWGFVPVDSPLFRWLVAAATIGLCLVAAVRYWRSFVFSRMPLPHAIVYAALWIALAQWIMATSSIWHHSWWIYHYLLLGAVVALLVGIFLQYVRGESLQRAVRGLLLADPVERLDVGLSPSVRALVLATEARDPYTAGHSYRVAVTAVRIGQALNLAAAELRALAIGGLVHDIGKIEVPDHILNKPGPLAPQERRIIQQHPEAGYRICRNVGFMCMELDVIRYHHERWDGKGYPAGLAGEAIPRLARILAVADAYDALTSNRSYRTAYTHEEAYRLILAGAGAAFDPDVVRAWASLAKEAPVVDASQTAPWSAPRAVPAS